MPVESHAALRRALNCGLRWMTPSFALWLLSTPFIAHLSDAIMLLIPVAATCVLGMLFSWSFSAFPGVASARLVQRAWVGALWGGMLALATGWVIHHFITGWGGPGGGAFQRPEVLATAVYFSWLIPLVAMAGALTPRRLLVPTSC